MAKTAVVVVLLLLIIPSWPPLHVVGTCEGESHTCYGCAAYRSNCPSCDPGRCCSPNHYCGSGLGYCTTCYCGKPGDRYECNLCYCQGTCPVGTDENPQYRYANSTYTGVVPDLGDDDDDNSSMIMVATCDNERNLNSGSNTTSSWRQHYRYGSAAICEPSPSSSSSNTTALSSSSSSSNTKNTTIVPGQCLQVTNLENGRRATVEITSDEQCSSNGTSLVLDYDVFQHLDTSDYKRNVGGNLTITYKHVGCIRN